MLKLGVVLVLTGNKRERKANVNMQQELSNYGQWTSHFQVLMKRWSYQVHMLLKTESLFLLIVCHQRKYWALNANLSMAREYAGSVQFSRSVMSDSLQLHGLQHARPPCPSQTPRAQKNKVWHCFHCFPIYFPWSDWARCHDLSFLNVLRQRFHSLLSLSSRGFLVLLHFPP